MNVQTATDEYALALRAGQKEYKDCVAAGRPGHPAVLDELLPENAAESVVDVGLVEIPMGTTLREIVEEIGGGVPNGNEVVRVVLP